jgi:porin
MHQRSPEVFANTTGGIKHGASGDGLTMLSIGKDTQKAFGCDGGTFNVSALGIYSPSFSQAILGLCRQRVASSPLRRCALRELWYQQAFVGGQMHVKVGSRASTRSSSLARDRPAYPSNLAHQGRKVPILDA